MNEIHAKGFKMDGITSYAYDQSIKVGVKKLEDALLNLGNLKTNDKGYTNKKVVLQALASKDTDELRAISEYWYNTNGIYQRVNNHFAYLYRYDWYVDPEMVPGAKVDGQEIKLNFYTILNFLDHCYIKKLCGDIALDVIRYGAYYGYIVPTDNGISLQKLPLKYCRSRYFIGPYPAVEFNMAFFDNEFKDPAYRQKVLKLFPKEFAKGYSLYKQGKIPSDTATDLGKNGWYLLDPQAAVKFNFNDNDLPLFVSAIPALIDLNEAQEIDRRRQLQNLTKILVQTLPTDKNGDLIFDVEEARDIHNNAVNMLKNTMNTDVLTTFAKISPVDMSDSTSSQRSDELERVERGAYNAFGTTQNLFNADGNLSTSNSVLNDEANIRKLLLQFNIFFNRIVEELNSNNKNYTFKFYMLETTQYNYKELSKMYKEQVQLGFSKVLPQIALGHSQASILAAAKFENDYLELSKIMIPPLQSSTMNAEALANVGRPEKAESEKSDKTLLNAESNQE